jgi:cytochrome c-type biogenesis protein
MLDATFSAAVIQGLIAFFSPCVLPMVPFYFSYMAGISMQELRDDGEIAPGAARRLVVSALFFALGVTTIFFLLGMGATAAGHTVRMWKTELTYGAAAIIFVFGLHFLGLIRVPFLYREAKFESKADPSTIVGAYLMGLAFGFGWSACGGPMLASILFMATMKDTIVEGGLLLMTFGLAMTAPFVLAAFFAKPFLRWMSRNRKYLAYVEKVMGVMLIIFAILMVTNTLNEIANFMIRVFPQFQSIG